MEKRKAIPPLLLLGIYAALGILLYVNALGNGFHYDDRYVIVENEGLAHTDRILSVFTGMELAGSDDLHRRHYRPLVYGSYMVNYAVGELNPAGYHAVNLAIHVLTAWLAALILIRLTGTFFAGSVAGLLFLVHPINVEAINYVTARSSQMYAVFYLLAFYAYVRFRPPAPREGGGGGPGTDERGHSRLWAGMAWTAFALSMLSKEMAVTFPLTLVLYEWLVRQRPEGWKWHHALRIPALLVLAVVVPYLAVREGLVGGESAGAPRDMISQLATQTVVLLRTLGLYLYPAPLTIDHPVEIYKTFANLPVIGASLLLAGLLGVFVRWAIHRDPEKRLSAFLLSWFFVVLSPVAIIPLNAVLQENRAYLAGVGILGLAALGIAGFDSWARDRNPLLRRGGSLILVLLLLTFGGLAIQRNRVWSDEATLWQDAVRKNPRSVEAHLGLGGVYHEKKDYSGAIAEYREVLRIKPDEFRALGNMAQIHRQQGNYGEALLEYQRLVRLIPTDATAHYGLGMTYRQSGDMRRAVAEYQAALNLEPGHRRALFQLGVAKASLGEKEEAIRLFEALLRATSRMPEVYHALGLLKAGDGRFGEAAALFREALRLDPGNGEYQNHLNLALRQEEMNARRGTTR